MFSCVWHNGLNLELGWGGGGGGMSGYKT